MLAEDLVRRADGLEGTDEDFGSMVVDTVLFVEDLSTFRIFNLGSTVLCKRGSFCRPNLGSRFDDFKSSEDNVTFIFKICDELGKIKSLLNFGTPALNLADLLLPMSLLRVILGSG